MPTPRDWDNLIPPDENIDRLLSQTKDMLFNCLVYRLAGQVKFTVEELNHIRLTVHGTRIAVNDKDETILTTVLKQEDYPNGR